jgi:predicted LPLAT superfamily acyltransferase
MSADALFNPCLLVPCYNHGAQIRATLEALQPFALPLILVDDGSDTATAVVLDQLAAADPAIDLLRLPENRGKGAAVAAGIERAAARGFTHALQIDADGQHDSGDIPALLALARANPEALVSGWPQYGDDMPRSRRYGRWITHVWVWIETLSFAIKDSMCGFRVYPVPATRALFASRAIGRRMDFDTDAMVRLYWRGVPVLFHPTRVRYPADGHSNFQLWRDNLRISWMHTRLVAEMPLQLPRLLGRQQGHWSERAERGAWWGMKASLWCYRKLGDRALRWLLYPIMGYFFLAGRSAREASRDYQLRLYRRGVLPLPPDAGSVFRHLYGFGEALVDRLASWAGGLRRDQLTFHGYESCLDYVKRDQGVVLFTAHVGNMEVTRALIEQSPIAHVHLNVLVHTRQAERINQLMREVNPRATLELIQIDELGPAAAADLQERLARGEWVVIAADRTSPTAPGRITAAEIFGDPAPFPQGPFILAALLGAPVLTLFCLRESDGYHVYLERFAERIQLPRKQRQQALAGWVQKYADALEQAARRAPLQWFNFYDFWQMPLEPQGRQIHAASAGAAPCSDSAPAPAGAHHPLLKNGS